MAVELRRVEDGEHGGGSGAAHEEHHDGDEYDHEHALLGTLQGAVLVAVVPPATDFRRRTVHMRLMSGAAVG